MYLGYATYTNKSKAMSGERECEREKWERERKKINILAR